MSEPTSLKGIIICVDSFHSSHAIPVEASVIELKEDVAQVKSEVKYISKQVDVMAEKLALMKEVEVYAKQ